MFIIALLIATAVPLIALYVIYRLDLYGTGSFRVVLFCFAWGLIAFALAYLLNSASLRYGLFSFDVFVRFTAPILEEILKGLLLLYLVRRPSFTYFVDGAIYGFAIGIGFAIVENYSYILGNQSAALGLAISRVISTNLMHATGSALIGVALGFARFQRPGRGLLTLLGGLVLAMAVHIGFNNLVTRVSSGLLLLYAAVIGVGGAAFIAFTIKRGLAEGKTWIQETLGSADRVTDHEAGIVHRLADVHELLTPVAEMFGPKKATQVERFLRLQAQLGIKRKTLEKLSDEQMRRDVEAQMADIRREMDKARREVGWRVMLAVREIMPPEGSPLWGRLDLAIDAQSQARAASGSEANLWSALDSRMAPRSVRRETEEES